MHLLFLASVFIICTFGGLIIMALLISSVRALFRDTPDAAWSESNVAHYEEQTAKEGYFHKALVALDIFLNVLILAGRQGETISTHAFIAASEKKIWGRVLNWWLNLIQNNHGYKAASGDLERSSAEVVRMRSLLKV